MKYSVVIIQDGDTARIPCESYEEALEVKVSFENYGKCQSITIEADIQQLRSETMSNATTTRIGLVSFRNDPHAVQVKCLACESLGEPMSRNWNWDEQTQTWEPQSRHIPDCKHFTHEREQSKGVVAKFSGAGPRLI